MMPPLDEELLGELLLQWEESRDRGTPLTAADLCRERPDLVDELERRILALRQMAFLEQTSLGNGSNDDAPAAPPANRTMPRMLAARYRIDHPIAEGGHGSVWRGHDIVIHRDVAIKLPTGGGTAATEAFMAEARLIATLQHPGILKVLDVGLQDGECFIVTELMDGSSLANRIETRPPSQQQAVKWVLQIAAALEACHRQHLVHRDVKPDNILIDRADNAVLADFGIAMSLRARDFNASAGTLPYKAPEQVRGEDIDHRVDIYSLALVLHKALTGRLPYSSTEPEQVRHEILAGLPAGLAPWFPRKLRPVVLKALSLAPDQRQQSAADFARELKDAWRRSTRRRRIAWVVWGGLAAFTVLGLVAAWRARGRHVDTVAAVEAQTAAAERTAQEGIGRLHEIDTMVARVRRLSDSIVEDTMSDPFHAGRRAESLGRKAARDGRLEEAVAHFTKAIECDPRDGTLLDQRGVCRVRLEQQAAALDDFEAAVRLRPNDPEIARHLEECRAALGRAK